MRPGVTACANANLYDKSDMYVCSTAVLGAACGVHVADPLAAYKSKFAGPKKEAPRNQDGTLRFTHADVDLAVLNTNNRLLQVRGVTRDKGLTLTLVVYGHFVCFIKQPHFVSLTVYLTTAKNEIRGTLRGRRAGRCCCP